MPTAEPVDSHGGPHVVGYSMNIVRAYFRLGGSPVGKTTLALTVEYDDPQCADEAAREIAGLLELSAWTRAE